MIYNVRVILNRIHFANAKAPLLPTGTMYSSSIPSSLLYPQLIRTTDVGVCVNSFRFESYTDVINHFKLKLLIIFNILIFSLYFNLDDFVAKQKTRIASILSVIFYNL